MLTFGVLYVMRFVALCFLPPSLLVATNSTHFHAYVAPITDPGGVTENHTLLRRYGSVTNSRMLRNLVITNCDAM